VRNSVIKHAGSQTASRKELGFTLVEVLVAMGILAIVGATFMISLSVGSRASLVSQERVNAESLAKSQMEDAKAFNYMRDATTYPVIDLGELADYGYAISVLAEPLSTPDDGIQKITVTVTLDGETVFTLSDYKVDR
jgi:prepilin-type N-terminal cleavage/methylation domain-containing protein